MLHNATMPLTLQATDALQVSKKVPVPVLNEDTHEAPQRAQPCELACSCRGIQATSGKVNSESGSMLKAP